MKIENKIIERFERIGLNEKNRVYIENEIVVGGKNIINRLKF